MFDELVFDFLQYLFGYGGKSKRKRPYILDTDKLLVRSILFLPMVLLTCQRILTPDLFQCVSVKCLPANANLSEDATMFVNVYCWERLWHQEKHHPINIQDYQINSQFPYLLISLSLLLKLPFMLWCVVFRRKIVNETRLLHNIRDLELKIKNGHKFTSF